MNQSFDLFQTPPPSVEPQKTDVEWPNTTVEGQLATSAGYQWPDTETFGLGLLPMISGGDDQAEIVHGLPMTTQSTCRPFLWPSELAATTVAPSQETPAFDFEDWPAQYNSTPTVMPAATMWDPSQQPTSFPAPVYEISPSPSSRSTASQLSGVSSPYARSEDYNRVVSSPRIKIEEVADRPHLFSAGTDRRRSLRRSFMFDPDDLAFQRSVVIDEDEPTPTLHHYSSSVNTKLEPHDYLDAGVRPGYRKAYSSDDVRRDLLEDRQKRAYTKPEDANCACDTCGKPFQRTYNLKVHMETHDRHRPQPHTCLYAGCDKRFVRRTDLVRHESSVHLKIRNCVCPMCDASFARKDTLRRHVDDGCPRRPEMKKRVGKARRPSYGTAPRRSSYQR